jgi:hypothetical protein
MPSTQHLLITRWNLGVYSGNGNQLNRERWMEVRLNLFARWCAPSVRAQTVQDFDWLLLIDPATPTSWRERIVNAAAFARARLVEVSHDGKVSERPIPAIADTIRRHVDPAAELLLTTRLDNDDALHRCAMERMRAELACQEPPCFADLQNGYFRRANGKRMGQVDCLRFENGGTPFMSLIEPIEPSSPPRTVYCTCHGLVREFGRVHHIEGEPAWIHVCHRGPGRNAKADKVRGRLVETTIPDGFPQAPEPAAATTGPLTLCMLHWRREGNLRKILDAMGKQTLRPVIWLWNNSGRPFTHPLVSWQIDSTRNLGPSPRWWLALQAATPFVSSWDDDVIPTDTRLLEDMVADMKERPPRCAIGSRGLAWDPARELFTAALRPGMPGFKSEVDTPVDFVVGNILCCRPADLRETTVAGDLTALAIDNCDDIMVSARLAGGRRLQHVCPAFFQGRVQYLSQPHALNARKGFVARREAATRLYFGIADGRDNKPMMPPHDVTCERWGQP